MAHKIKLIYPGSEPGGVEIIEVWTDGPHALAGHVLDAMFGLYGQRPNDTRDFARMLPIRMEITPNSPDTPNVSTRGAEEHGSSGG
jgi:hypothetical protein